MKLVELLKKIGIVRIILYAITLISFVGLLWLWNVPYVSEVYYQYAMPNAILVGSGCIAIGFYEGRINRK